MELAQQYRPNTMDDPVQEAQRRAELLVSSWHLATVISWAKAPELIGKPRRASSRKSPKSSPRPLATIERLHEDAAAAPAKPKRAAAPK